MRGCAGSSAVPATSISSGTTGRSPRPAASACRWCPRATRYYSKSSGISETSRTPAATLSIEGVPQNDGLGTVRTGGYDVQGHAQQFLDALQIVPGVLRQLRIIGDADGGALPARHILVYRFRLGETLGPHGRNGDPALGRLVGDADADGVQAVQHVHLGDADAGDAVADERAAQG